MKCTAKVTLKIVVRLTQPWDTAKSLNEVFESAKREAQRKVIQLTMCVPGTNAIISRKEASAWHDLVATAGIGLDVTAEQLPAFCDLAGVAD